MRILLVEDDPHTAAFIAKGLKEDGHAVDQADNGRDGLFMAGTERYDAIVLDRMLPQVDGMTVLRTLRGTGARLDSLARRGAGGGAEPVRLRVADLELDLLRREAVRARRRIELQPREYRLLEYLMRQADRVVTRTMLLEAVWDYHFDPQTNVIDVHISRLRQKIDQDFGTPLLHTVRGAGYRLGA
ncbi:MAG: response regulator transcription factor [Lysobacter sp.]|nr:response regulator transcription factor [Lysobacter sp.]